MSIDSKNILKYLIQINNADLLNLDNYANNINYTKHVTNNEVINSDNDTLWKNYRFIDINNEKIDLFIKTFDISSMQYVSNILPAYLNKLFTKRPGYNTSKVKSELSNTKTIINNFVDNYLNLNINETFIVNFYKLYQKYNSLDDNVFQYYIVNIINKYLQPFLEKIKEDNFAINVVNNINTYDISDIYDNAIIRDLLHKFNYFKFNNKVITTYEWFVTNVKIDDSILDIAKNIGINFFNITLQELYFLIARFLQLKMTYDDNKESLYNIVTSLIVVPYYLPCYNNTDILTRLNPIFPIILQDETYNKLITTDVFNNKINLNNIIENQLVTINFQSFLKIVNKSYIKEYKKYIYTKYAEYSELADILLQFEIDNLQQFNYIKNIDDYITIPQIEDYTEITINRNIFIENEIKFLEYLENNSEQYNPEYSDIILTNIFEDVIINIGEYIEENLYKITESDFYNSHYILFLIRVLNFSTESIDIIRNNYLTSRNHVQISYYQQPLFENYNERNDDNLRVIEEEKYVFLKNFNTIKDIIVIFNDKDIISQFGFARLNESILNIKNNNWIYISNNSFKYSNNMNLPSLDSFNDNTPYDEIRNFISNLTVGDLKEIIINYDERVNNLPMVDVINKFINKYKIYFPHTYQLFYMKNNKEIRFSLNLFSKDSIDYMYDMVNIIDNLYYYDDDYNQIKIDIQSFNELFNNFYKTCLNFLPVLIKYYKQYTLLNEYLDSQSTQYITEVLTTDDISKYITYSVNSIVKNIDSSDNFITKPYFNNENVTFSYREIKNIDKLFVDTFTHKQLSVRLNKILRKNIISNNIFDKILNDLIKKDASFRELFDKYFLIIFIIIQYVRLWGGPDVNYVTKEYSQWNKKDIENNIFITTRVKIISFLIRYLDLIKKTINDKIEHYEGDDSKLLFWESSLILYNGPYIDNVENIKILTHNNYTANIYTLSGIIDAFSKLDYCMGFVTGFLLKVIYSISYYNNLTPFLIKENIINNGENVAEVTKQFNDNLIINFDNFVNTNLPDLIKDILEFANSEHYISTEDFREKDLPIYHEIIKDAKDINNLIKLTNTFNLKKQSLEQKYSNVKDFTQNLKTLNQIIYYEETLQDLKERFKSASLNLKLLETNGFSDLHNITRLTKYIGEIGNNIQENTKLLKEHRDNFDKVVNKKLYKEYIEEYKSYSKILYKTNLNIKMILMNEYYIRIEQVKLLKNSLSENIVPIDYIDKNNYYRKHEPENINIAKSMLPFVYINNQHKVNMLKNNIINQNNADEINNLSDIISNIPNIDKDFKDFKNIDTNFYNNILGNPIFFDSWNSILFRTSSNRIAIIDVLRFLNYVELLGFNIKFYGEKSYNRARDNNFSDIIAEINSYYSILFLINKFKRYLANPKPLKLIYDPNVHLEDYRKEIYHTTTSDDTSLVKGVIFDDIEKLDEITVKYILPDLSSSSSSSSSSSNMNDN